MIPTVYLPFPLPPQLLGGDTLTRAEWLAWYQTNEPSLPTATLDWRLHELVRAGTLRRQGRGRYALASASPDGFQPVMPDELASLWRGLAQHLGDQTGCVWTTMWLHEWMLHQPARETWVIEVPRDALITAFYYLLDARGGAGVFVQPDARTTATYVSEAARPALVLPLVSQAPVQRVAGVPVPKLEKLLVDVFAEPVRLAAYQGAELGRIFSGAVRQGPLVPATFWRYAQRRKRADALRKWLRLRADEPALRQLADWPAQR